MKILNVAIGCLLCFGSYSIGAQAAPSHWRVIWTENPQTQATISWSTSEVGNTHRVYYDTQSRKGNLSAYANQLDRVKNGKYPDSGLTLYYHHAELTKLQPHTTYYFVMLSDESVSPEFHFITAPDRDIPIKIIYGGDSRSGDKGTRAEINRLIAKTAAAEPQIIAFAHGGDYVNRGGERTRLEWWSRWLTDHELTVTPEGRILPIIPARGNHEGSNNSMYNEVFNWPGSRLGGRNYYASKLSSQVLLITLATNGSGPKSEKQTAFLEQTLQENQSMRFKLAQYHSPAYPAMHSPGVSGAFKYFVPLFEKYNLTMACESHGHTIKRTVPIRNGKMAADGVVYIGEGGLGSGPRTPNVKRWYLKPPAKVGSDYHFQVLGFNKKSIHYRVILLSGKIFDEHTISVK